MTAYPEFEATRALFYLPSDVLYFDGNSLGPQPLAVRNRMRCVVEEEWADQLIRGWVGAHWMDQPTLLGDRVGALIGAEPGTVTMGDTLSIKIFQLLSAALQEQPARKIVLSDTGNFPTDLYMAEGLLKHVHTDHTLKLIDPADIESNLDESVAALLITHVDYRSGRMHNMQRITARCRDLGIPVVWDLAHSAGAVKVELQRWGVDYAAGCTYKYLNAGPGAPAFVYVSKQKQAGIEPILSGWLGHQQPFDFESGYVPGTGIERMRIGTPPVLSFAAVEAALGVWDGISIDRLRARSVELSELFIAQVTQHIDELTLASPMNSDERGSQVSFRFEHGYAAIQALIHQHGMIGDFRAPDIMRFAITPLYMNEQDVIAGVTALRQVFKHRQWDNPDYRIRAPVT
ncbi:MAG: kynureninase [Gammaproteobacteria bacterium]|nr:kynureninase [Gammaproteobacteria bacterium]